MLDQSFKNKFFTDRLKRDNAKTLLEAELSGLLASDTSSSSTDTTEAPAEKKARTSIMKAFDEIPEEEGIFTVTTASSTSSLVDAYLAEPLLPYHSGNAYTWWKKNKARFEPLSHLALKYLLAPPTSIQSVRLFQLQETFMMKSVIV